MVAPSRDISRRQLSDFNCASFLLTLFQFSWSNRPTEDEGQVAQEEDAQAEAQAQEDAREVQVGRRENTRRAAAAALDDDGTAGRDTPTTTTAPPDNTLRGRRRRTWTPGAAKAEEKVRPPLPPLFLPDLCCRLSATERHLFVFFGPPFPKIHSLKIQTLFHLQLFFCGSSFRRWIRKLRVSC